jgi:hypothetical protein
MSYIVDLAAMRGEAEATPQLSPEKPYKSSLVTLNRTLRYPLAENLDITNPKRAQRMIID